jgi:hypothetical protein
MTVKGLKVNSLNTSDDVPGLVLVSSTTIGSAVSSVSVDSVFSATYNHYKILCQFNAFSAGDVFYYRFRTSGTDNTTSNYRYQGNDWYTSWNPWYNVNYGNSFGVIHRYTRTNGVHISIDLFNPFATNYTSMVSMSTQVGEDPGFNSVGGGFIATTSFDGIKFYPASGTMTGGTIKVYGYNN